MAAAVPGGGIQRVPIPESASRTLTAADPSYIGYARRLHRARDAIEEGNIEYLASPLVDSYHTAWFEWHERLLTTLGLKREE